MNKPYVLQEYLTDDDRKPFLEWVKKVKDSRARLKIAQRLERAEFGNFGDWKELKGTDGICEMRIMHGPGYRLYYRIVEGTVVLLLIGSTKADQKSQIARASAFFEDYKRRNSDA